MTPRELERYAPLYANPRYLGAADILRKFLSLGADAPIPLSLSHGVDFGHCHYPFDVDSIEPIHWSYNDNLHAQALRTKPSVRAPHPWAITVADRAVPGGRGVLVVGPPPSPENDERLYERIRTDARSDWTVLVKARGEFQGSLDFWHARGLQTVTAGGPDVYEKLFALLSQYETVVGCTFSSVLIFAASLGKQIRLLRDYYFEAYEPTDYEAEVNLHSRRAQAFVRAFASTDRRDAERASRALLGFDMLGDAARIRADMDQAVASLDRAYHSASLNPVSYKLRESLALLTKKPGFIKYSPTFILSIFRRRTLCVMRINDIDVWLSGKNDENYKLISLRSPQERRLQAGQAPRGYDAASIRRP